jgi:hypothetical protein
MIHERRAARVGTWSLRTEWNGLTDCLSEVIQNMVQRSIAASLCAGYCAEFRNNELHDLAAYFRIL